MPQVNSKIKDDFEVINQFTLFRSPSLMNLSRVSNLPKTDFNWAPVWCLERTRTPVKSWNIEFKPRLKFFKLYLRLSLQKL